MSLNKLATISHFSGCNGSARASVADPVLQPSLRALRRSSEGILCSLVSFCTGCWRSDHICEANSEYQPSVSGWPVGRFTLSLMVEATTEVTCSQPCRHEIAQAS